MITLRKHPGEITGYTSLILDGLRILAALFVLISHVFTHWFPATSETLFFDKAAHLGVIVFFVLSGSAIAYTTIKKNRGGSQYMAARFSRLYAVVFPALLITAIIQIIVYFLDHSLYEEFSRSPSWLRYALSSLFLNEVWLFSAGPPINGPLWSLGYEFWYYIIFGVFFYKGAGWKWFLPGLIACIVAGPKILLMMPIWLFGYLIFRYPISVKSKTLSWGITFVSFLLAAMVFMYVPAFPSKIGFEPLFFSNQFLTDWILGLCVASGLWFMPTAKKRRSSTALVAIRQAADLTFPVYVLHFPLMILYDAIFKDKINQITALFAPFLTIITVSVIIGLYLEKYRYLWVDLFNWTSANLAQVVEWNKNLLKMQSRKF